MRFVKTFDWYYIFCFVFLFFSFFYGRGGHYYSKLFPLPTFLDPCLQNIDVPSVLHGFCFSVLHNPLPEDAFFPFLGAHCLFFCYTHTLLIELHVFVTHLLASRPHVLAVVLL